MKDSVHFYDYTVVKKSEGEYRLRKYLTILLYILGPLLLLLLMLYWLGPAAFIWFVPLCPTAMMIVIRLSYNRFFCIEYEYRIDSGIFTVTESGGRFHRKVLFSAPLVSLTVIAPYPPAINNGISPSRRIIRAVSSMSSPDLYYTIIADPHAPSLRTVLIFEATAAMLRLFRLYNANTVVGTVRF